MTAHKPVSPSSIAAIAAAVLKSKRDIEEIVARLQPRPDVQSSVRRLPEAPVPTLMLPAAPARSDSPMSESLAPVRVNTPRKCDSVEPLAPARGDTRCSSPSHATPMRNSGACRISCVTEFPTEIQQSSLIER